jgi:hypothetical protein
MSRRLLTLLVAALVIPLAAFIALWTVTPSSAGTTPDVIRETQTSRPDVEPNGPGAPPATVRPETPAPVPTPDPQWTGPAQGTDPGKCAVCGGGEETWN